MMFQREEGRQEARNLIEKFRRVNNLKLQKHLSAEIDEARNLLRSIGTDPTTQKLKADMKRLLEDLILDPSTGAITFKPEVLDQLRLLTVRAILDRVNIPLPTMRSADGTMVYKISNMIMGFKDLIPSRIVIEDRGRLALDLTNIGEADPHTIEEASNRLTIKIEKINLHIQDMDVKFKRLSFPKVEDRGKARLDIDGEGMDIYVDLATYPGSYRLFRIERLECDVHSLSLELSDTSHDFLYQLFLPFIRGKIKTDIEEGVEHMLRGYLNELNRLAARQMRKLRKAGKSLSPNTIYGFAADRLASAFPSMEGIKEQAKKILPDVTDTQKDRKKAT